MSKTSIAIEGLFDTCEYCQRVMIPRDLRGHGSPFQYPLEDQMKAHGWVFQGADIPGTDHEDYACVECTQAGKITFTCEICKQERTSTFLKKDQYDEPTCTVCYETMTAKAWADWHDEQGERNRWYYS